MKKMLKQNNYLYLALYNGSKINHKNHSTIDTNVVILLSTYVINFHCLIHDVPDLSFINGKLNKLKFSKENKRSCVLHSEFSFAFEMYQQLHQYDFSSGYNAKLIANSIHK